MIVKKFKNNISIRALISIVLMSFLIITTSLTGAIIFSSWIRTTDELTVDMATNLNQDVFDEVDEFIRTPLHLTTVNGNLIQLDACDTEDEVTRNRFFASILQTHPDFIHSFSYATVEGDYFGARRRSGNIEVLKKTEANNGFTMYHELTDDYLAGEVIAPAELYDPRTAEWYLLAQSKGSHVFSPISQHGSTEELLITASYPVYDNNNDLKGVLAARIFLSSIDEFLNGIIDEDSGFAMLVEKDTGELIASSLELNVIRTLDGKITRRISVDEAERSSAVKAYNEYIQTGEAEILIDNDDSASYYTNVIEYSHSGLDWLIISAIREDILAGDITRNVRTSALLVIIMTIVSLFIYYFTTNKFTYPLKLFENAANRFAKGDMSERLPIVRNDEIGKISNTFNMMADQISHMVENLENIVEKRTNELRLTSESLKESQEKLRLIMDSTAESVYGMDLNGICTFCNNSCIKSLGYSHENDLLGKNMHDKIHHSYSDGSKMDITECKIYKAITSGKGVKVQDDVFWKADGTKFYVDYFSYPQFKDGKVVGAVVSFVDNTQRKKSEEEIRYLSCHDNLTGLYNRNCFMDKLTEIDKSANLPISVIYGDVTGLKLTNDIFGHAAGDDLISNCANALKKASRDGDLVARLGGDEFIMILPKTTSSKANSIATLVHEYFSVNSSSVIQSKMPLGVDTKYTMNQDIQDVIDSAESKMYKKKSEDRKSTNQGLLDNIINSLHDKARREKMHAENVSKMSKAIAIELKLPQAEVNKIERAAYLHDVGKIILDKELLNKPRDKYTSSENRLMQQHAIVGFRILNLFDDTVDLADTVYSHHEYWDGSGYPNGLKGKDIPLYSRILSIAERFDTRTDRIFGEVLSKEDTIAEIKKLAGIKFDPQVVDAFSKAVKKL